MDVIHERVAGLDVHKETIVACVRIMVGRKAHRECRTFDTTTFGLMALLTWLTESGCTHVAMEATGVYWKPVWNILSDGRFELILANAAHIKNVPGRKTAGEELRRNLPGRTGPQTTLAVPQVHAARGLSSTAKPRSAKPLTRRFFRWSMEWRLKWSQPRS